MLENLLQQNRCAVMLQQETPWLHVDNAFIHQLQPSVLCCRGREREVPQLVIAALRSTRLRHCVHVCDPQDAQDAVHCVEVGSALGVLQPPQGRTH